MDGSGDKNSFFKLGEGVEFQSMDLRRNPPVPGGILGLQAAHQPPRVALLIMHHPKTETRHVFGLVESRHPSVSNTD